MSTPASHPPLPHPGLTPAQVEESRRAHGSNALTPPEREPWWKQFLSKFEDPVIRILIVAAVSIGLLAVALRVSKANRELASTGKGAAN